MPAIPDAQVLGPCPLADDLTRVVEVAHVPPPVLHAMTNGLPPMRSTPPTARWCAARTCRRKAAAPSPPGPPRPTRATDSRPCGSRSAVTGLPPPRAPTHTHPCASPPRPAPARGGGTPHRSGTARARDSPLALGRCPNALRTDAGMLRSPPFRRDRQPTVPPERSGERIGLKTGVCRALRERCRGPIGSGWGRPTPVQHGGVEGPPGKGRTERVTKTLRSHNAGAAEHRKLPRREPRNDGE